jgi:hypothetical protein
MESEILKSKPTIQERMELKAFDAYGEVEFAIDKWLDGDTSFDMSKYLKQLDYSSRVVKFMKGQTQSLIEEVENKEGCEQLEEAWNHLTKTRKKQFIKFLHSIEKSIDTYLENYTPVRKPPKPKTPAQLVKKLPYLDKWEKYQSVNPEEIIRAKMLFTWNTSSKKMTCFESYGGLKVRGSDIIDFDVCTEKTLTDTKLLDRIVTGGNIIAKGFMDEIPRSKSKDGNNRITKNTLLIKVIK